MQRTRSGLSSEWALAIQIAAAPSSGHVFVEKTIPSDIEGGITQCGLAWWFRADDIDAADECPRIVYIGEPVDLTTNAGMQRFVEYRGKQTASTNPESPLWLGHLHRLSLDTELEAVRVALGWKITTNGSRNFLIDEILTFGR